LKESLLQVIPSYYKTMKDPLEPKLNELESLKSQYPITIHGRIVHYEGYKIPDNLISDIENIGLSIAGKFKMIENYCVEVK